MKEKRMTRSRQDRMLLGVASGLADYFGTDPVIFRLLFVVMFLSGGHGLLIYLALALLMPDEEPTVAKARPFEDEEIVIKEA